jgi:hypothetical protein
MLLRKSALGVLLCLPLAGHAQVEDFCDLLDTRIVADDGQFIGRITPDTVAIDSLVNPFGDHGSEFSQVSILNPFGPYGGMFALLSPFNPTTFFPPGIVQDGQTLARLTLNDSFSPRVDPNELLSWLRSDEPLVCFQPTPSPTAAATPTATALPSSTPSQSPTPTSVDSTPSGTAPTAGRTRATATARASNTPRPTSPLTPTNMATQRNTPGQDADDEGCAIVAPATTPTVALLPIALALLRLFRRSPTRKAFLPHHLSSADRVTKSR